MGEYMTKGKISRMVLSMGFLLALSACGEIEGIDYLSLGHPADPDARTGKQQRMSSSLVPELITVKPDVAPAKPESCAVGRSITPVHYLTVKLMTVSVVAMTTIPASCSLSCAQSVMGSGRTGPPCPAKFSRRPSTAMTAPTRTTSG